MYGGMLVAMTRSSAGVKGTRWNAAQPAFGYARGLAAASEPYSTRATPIWITRDEGGGRGTEQVLVAVDDRCLRRLWRGTKRKSQKDCAENESHDQYAAVVMQFDFHELMNSQEGGKRSAPPLLLSHAGQDSGGALRLPPS
jgi:hypothetical protein